MLTDILLARHGETDWNLNHRWQGHTDIPLNVNGENQARKLAETLHGTAISAVFSSDLKRAYSTAKTVSRVCGVDSVTIDPRLRERYLGTFEGLTSLEISEKLGVEKGSFSISDLGKNPTIESWEIFVGRVEAALQEIRRIHEGSSVLVVAHGGVMLAALNIFSGRNDTISRFMNGEYMRLTFDGGTCISVQRETA